MKYSAYKTYKMTRVIVCSEVMAGTYTGSFPTLLGSPGPTLLI